MSSKITNAHTFWPRKSPSRNLLRDILAHDWNELCVIIFIAALFFLGYGRICCDIWCSIVFNRKRPERKPKCLSKGKWIIVTVEYLLQSSHNAESKSTCVTMGTTCKQYWIKKKKQDLKGMHSVINMYRAHRLRTALSSQRIVHLIAKKWLSLSLIRLLVSRSILSIILLPHFL